MKRVTPLPNGSSIEIDDLEIRFIGPDGSLLYSVAIVDENKNLPNLPYFFLMGEPERKKVAEWFNKVNPRVDNKKERQCKFLERVQKALDVINYDYYIATLEPSFDENGNIFYEEGKPVGREIRLYEWKEKATVFYSKDEWYSELAQLEEGDLFKAYRIAMGLWSLEYVCDASSSAGNYWNAPNPSYDFEVSGARTVGGFKDGIGNTYEIYQTEFGFALVGGCYYDYGDFFPVADVIYGVDPISIGDDGSGVLVLKRNTAR